MSGGITGNAPDMRKIIQAGAENVVKRLRFVDVGVVTDIDNASRRATVRPLAAIPTPDRQKREVAFESPQPIEDVPIGMIGGAAAALYIPVTVGDYVLMIWVDRGMDEIKGGAFRGTDETLPQDIGAFHAYNACFALPLRLFDAETIAEDVERVGLGAHPVIYAPTYLTVGDASSSVAVALSNRVDAHLATLRARIDEIATAYNGHSHGVGVVPQVAGSTSSLTSTAAAHLKTS